MVLALAGDSTIIRFSAINVQLFNNEFDTKNLKNGRQSKELKFNSNKSGLLQ